MHKASAISDQSNYKSAGLLSEFLPPGF